jgi:hypothetical protein
MKKINLFLLLALVLFSCEPSNEDLVQKVPTDGSIECTVETINKDTVTVLYTKYKFWKLGIQREKCYVDTLPSLGNTTEVGEDQNGNEKTFIVPKNYEVYITVK